MKEKTKKGGEQDRQAVSLTRHCNIILKKKKKHFIFVEIFQVLAENFRRKLDMVGDRKPNLCGIHFMKCKTWSNI